MTFLPFDELLGFEASDKRLDILRRVGEAGSISKAARSAGVSYKAAWQAIEALTNLAGTPLINTAVGGSGGGGAVLTSAGQKLLVVAAAFAQARQQLLAQLAELTDTEVAGVTSAAVAAGLRTS
ncbi:MAG: LysR family transcriptional regulator, partial [Pusillimonas sp.]